MSMTKARLDGLFFLILGCAVLLAGNFIRMGSVVDFRTLYYGTRCLLHRQDPYLLSNVEQAIREGAGERAAGDPVPLKDTPDYALFVYFPNAIPFMTPFAALPWEPAHTLWMLFVDASLLLAAWLIWSLGANTAPAVYGGMAGLVLASGLFVMVDGNPSAIVVGLCVGAVYCFMRERFPVAGVVCLALALILKPQDAGLLWLFFLLAGGVHRQRALQVFAVFAVLSLPGILWVSHAVPHWAQEVHTNLVTAEAHGGQSDPTPASVNTGTAATITSLQTVFSFFWSEPRIYNLASFLLCAPLLLAWAITTVRARFTPPGAWLGIAAIAALSLLPAYHRLYDAKLLLLTIPACALLWKEGSRSRWPALILTMASMAATSELAVVLLIKYAQGLHLSTTELSARLLTIALTRPAPLLLLPTGILYLWAYMRYPRRESVSTPTA
jgi:hypothetical protein